MNGRELSGTCASTREESLIVVYAKRIKDAVYEWDRVRPYRSDVDVPPILPSSDEAAANESAW